MSPTEPWPDIYCRTCGARSGQPCKTGSGRVAYKPHKQRTSKPKRSATRRRTVTQIPAEARKAAALRSRGRCEFIWRELRCDRRGAHLHHKRRRSQGGSNDLANLVHLCAIHHVYVHDHPAWSSEHGYLERSTA